MQRIAQAWRAKPGKADEYRKFHAEVWPEVEQALRDGGVATCVIYAWGDLFFGYTEVEDYEEMVRVYNANPAAQRWESEIEDLIEYPDGDPQTGFPLTLAEVWSLNE